MTPPRNTACPPTTSRTDCYFCIPSSPCRDHAHRGTPTPRPTPPVNGVDELYQRRARGEIIRITTKLAELAVDSGERHAQLVNTANYCFRLANGGGVDHGWVRAQLEYACDRNGYTAGHPGRTARDIDDCENNVGAGVQYLDDRPLPDQAGNTDVGHLDTADAAEGGADQPGATWQPIDLGPYLRGEITPPEPTLGVARDDGQRCVYAGREHAVIGETESGKTWFCLLCAAAEMRAGNDVVYIHFEEADPSSTVERLKFLGLSDDAISAHLVFIGPAEQVRSEWLGSLIERQPTLVVLDGINEAMALHGSEIKAAEGWSDVRRRLVTPFLRAGAAVLSCDHLPMGTDHTRRDAYGTVHKGNAIDGARFVLVNKEPFGRGMRGMSLVYLTKDRPGALRIHARQTGVPGRSYFGALAIDATGNSPELWGFYPPRDTDQEGGGEGGDPVAEAVIGDLAKAGGSVKSFNKLCDLLRADGMGYQRTRIRDAVDHLVQSARLLEVPGARGATEYRLPDRTDSATGSGSGSDEAAA